jgi:pimeloyl-ACP methyl ester carboxylesterase
MASEAFIFYHGMLENMLKKKESSMGQTDFSSQDSTYESNPFSLTYQDETASFHHLNIQHNQLNWHIVKGGSGLPLVLLSGFPQSWYAWRKVMPALAQHYTVLAIELPGLGETDGPVMGYDTGSIAKHLHDLLQYSGYEQYLLVSHDIGAWVAYPYAVEYTEEVRKLVLLDAGIPGLVLDGNITASPALWKQRWHFLFQALTDLPEQLVEGKEHLYLSWFFREKARDRHTFEPEDIDTYTRIYSKPGVMKAAFNYYRALFQDIEQNQRFMSKPLMMPVMVYGGEYATARMLQGVAQVAQNIHGGIIEDCGHYIPEEKPAILRDHLLAFLQEEA